MLASAFTACVCVSERDDSVWKFSGRPLFAACVLSVVAYVSACLARSGLVSMPLH